LDKWWFAWYDSKLQWIIIELFEFWLNNHFLKHVACERSLLLLVWYARRNEVLLSCLPPHITHKSQPLDCMVFSPLNAQWGAVFHNFSEPILEKAATKFNFALFFAQAWLLFL